MSQQRGCLLRWYPRGYGFHVETARRRDRDATVALVPDPNRHLVGPQNACRDVDERVQNLLHAQGPVDLLVGSIERLELGRRLSDSSCRRMFWMARPARWRGC